MIITYVLAMLWSFSIQNCVSHYSCYFACRGCAEKDPWLDGWWKPYKGECGQPSPGIFLISYI